MKESEAKGFIQGKLNCMKKCGVFNKEDNINYNNCDYCHYCYSQGNFGQQKEAFNVAIKALEKQIPKKYMRKNGNYNCPICDYPVMSVCTRKKKYCDNCGQAIDWSEKNE